MGIVTEDLKDLSPGISAALQHLRDVAYPDVAYPRVEFPPSTNCW
jgi:hypothetical protein